MQNSTRTRFGRAATVSILAATVVFIAGCASQKPTSVASKKRSKEYFAESEYGVKASPRVTTAMSNLPRGGGRDQTGKPYKVRGKWYYPKEDKNYAAMGPASWYGDAFHGRLTANGEIYDMTHLTAAHPTMPLPSYARVTNAKNGASIVVRVNDRGPYAHGRIIDLSRRAAEMLDYTHSGVAKVEVEYIGRAPLHGRDDEYLMASYRPPAGGGGRAPSPIDDGLPSGVMIAMNGSTPTQRVMPGAPVPFPGQPPVAVGAPMGGASAGTLVAGLDLVLPEFGPIVPERPSFGLASRTVGTPTLSLSYADQRVKRAAQAVTDFADTGKADELVAALNRRYAAAAARKPEAQGYIAVGTYADQSAAETMAAALGGAGRVAIDTDWRGDGFALSLHPDGRHGLDDMLRAAWAAGAADAMPVRE